MPERAPAWRIDVALRTTHSGGLYDRGPNALDETLTGVPPRHGFSCSDQSPSDLTATGRPSRLPWSARCSLCWPRAPTAPSRSMTSSSGCGARPKINPTRRRKRSRGARLQVATRVSQRWVGRRGGPDGAGWICRMATTVGIDAVEFESPHLKHVGGSRGSMAGHRLGAQAALTARAALRSWTCVRGRSRRTRQIGSTS